MEVGIDAESLVEFAGGVYVGAVFKVNLGEIEAGFGIEGARADGFDEGGVRGVETALASEGEVRARCAAVVAERDRLTAALRERGLDVSDSQANFVWLPTGEQTAELAAALEARAVITRPFAGEGIRVTVGTPEEDDVFLAALDQVRASIPGG